MKALVVNCSFKHYNLGAAKLADWLRFEACYERAMQVIGWGGEPWCQFVLPLNWLGDPTRLEPKHGWTYQQGRDFCRFFNRRLWRKLWIQEYWPRLNEAPPFRELAA